MPFAHIRLECGQFEAEYLLAREAPGKMAMLQNQAIPTDKIMLLEAEMRKMPQVMLPITHDFCDGVYARTMHLPAGVMLTGHFHKNENFIVIRSGEMKIWTGYEAVEVGGGFMSVSPAGCKRVGLTLTDVVLTTFHPNPDNERDPEILWDMYVTDDPLQVQYTIELMLENKQ